MWRVQRGLGEGGSKVWSSEEYVRLGGPSCVLGRTEQCPDLASVQRGSSGQTPPQSSSGIWKGWVWPGLCMVLWVAQVIAGAGRMGVAAGLPLPQLLTQKLLPNIRRPQTSLYLLPHIPHVSCTQSVCFGKWFCWHLAEVALHMCARDWWPDAQPTPCNNLYFVPSHPKDHSPSHP
jgi:hypothetical protein